MENLSKKEIWETYPSPEWSVVYNNSNQFVIRRNVEPIVAGNNTAWYKCYLLDKSNGLLSLICEGEDWKSLLDEASKVWDPPPVYPKINARIAALDHIENMLSSLVKRDRQVLRKDLSYIYMSGGGWKSFTPNSGELLGFHLSKEENQPAAWHTCKYCEFLKSERYEETLNKEWEE